MAPPPLRIGFVPEHFAVPLFFAPALYATLLPFPSGTGHMITALRSGEIDVAIGLTEGFVAGLGKAHEGDGGYRMVGTYVSSPLCWAISAGSSRSDLTSISDLKGAKVGVSRLGSGSHIMSYVLADQQSWLQSGSEPFTFHPLQTFANLRQGANDGTADVFMWETFTSKKYHDSGEIRRVGEISTPWPSWMIVAGTGVKSDDQRLEDLFTKLDQGVKRFEEEQNEAVQWIARNLDYSEEDARAWLRTVQFVKGVRGVDLGIIEHCYGILEKAGVVGDGLKPEQMIGIMKK